MRTILAVTVLAVGLWAPAARAQAPRQFTLDPMMTKGPATAPVSIIEFGDYE